ncbi:MAG: glycosyl hydrolase [Gemmatimonadota bacterium]
MRHRPTRALTLLLSVAALPLAVQGQTPDQVASVANALEFREVGPTIMSGRIVDLAVVESDPATFYVGTATGGLWKTVNNGISFEPIFDEEITASVGAVSVAPSNPNVVWVGTGEPQNRQSSPWGNGVYRSTDSGHTWSHLGLDATHHIARIAVHPRDPDVAYVAAVGRLWGSSPERGVYKTLDGGVTWSHVLYIDDHTGAIDMVMDPADPLTLFVATYQRQRKAWGFNGGGPGSGIYRTTDGGAHWVELTDGLPQGDMGRIGLDVYLRDPNFVCAIVEADLRIPGQGFGGGGTGDVRNGVYCSTDRGETWEHRSTTNNRPMYYSRIEIDPNDPERIYLGGANAYRSSDGGRTFTADAAAGVHLDHHAFWINPENSEHIILGSDGGVSISYDRSDNWYQFRNLPLAQFYEIGVDMRDPYHVCGGLQDNGSWCAPSDTWSNQGIRTRDWYNVGSGDGFFTVMHPTDTMLMFAESQGGNLIRVDLSTMERARLRPIGRPEMDGGDLPSLRWNWNSPIVLSSHDDNTLYFGGNVLFKSTDLGQSFEAISGDLTWAIDRDTLSIMGVPGGDPQMSRNDGQSSYGNLTAVAESPLDAQTLYTGSDDGRVHVSRDGGATWTDITANFEGLPAYTYVTRIVASETIARRVVVAFDGHRDDDFEAYVYVSDDFGESFERRTAGLPASSISALAEHPDNPSLLFVGNEQGVWVSVDAGGGWVQLRSNLPTMPVDDIKIHPRENDLVLGTHGRGIWILDDVTPLERLTEQAVTAPAFLFPVRRATSYNMYTPQGWTPGIYAADNGPYGAILRYHLAADVDDLVLRVTDATGNTIRTMRNAPSDAGLNQIAWDLRLVEEDESGQEMDPGPRVMPGTYIVELTTGDDIVQTEVVVRLDPRVEMGRRPMQQRHLAMLESYRLEGPIDRADDAIGDMEDLLDGVEELLGSRARSAAVQEALTRARQRLDEVEEELDDASDGAGMWRQIQAVSGPPTADQLFLLEESWRRAPAAIEAVNATIDDVEAVLDLVYTEAGRPALPDAAPAPSRGG